MDPNAGFWITGYPTNSSGLFGGYLAHWINQRNFIEAPSMTPLMLSVIRAELLRGLKIVSMDLFMAVYAPTYFFDPSNHFTPEEEAEAMLLLDRMWSSEFKHRLDYCRM